MSLERTLADLIQKLERRFYGKYRGFVMDSNDPKKLARLKLKIPSVLGSEVISGWAMPCMPYGGSQNQGMLFIPEVNSGVWVEFEEGDLEFPIWVGTYWGQPESETELPLPNEKDGSEASAAIDPMVSRKIIKTLKGHTIQFEDKDGEEMITIVQNVDDEKYNVITMNAEGINITDANLNFVVLNESGIAMKDFTENEFKMSDSAVSIVAKQSLTIDADGQAMVIKAQSLKIEASSIDLKKS